MWVDYACLLGFLNVVTFLYLALFEDAQVQLLGPYAYYKTLSDNMRMTFHHRNAIPWTPSLPKSFEGHIITEVGNLTDYIKILKAVTLLQAEHKSCTLCWTTHQCWVFAKTSKSFSKSWLRPNRFQMRDVVTHGVCFSSTLISTMSKNIFHTKFLSVWRNFSPPNWRVENQYLQSRPIKNTKPDL